MISESDKLLLEKKGISLEELQIQLENFKKGNPFLKLAAPASIEKGIMVVTPDKEQYYLDSWDTYRSSGRKVVKFVPASGAASRMFKDLFEFLDAPYDKPTSVFEKDFFDNLSKFAFYEELNEACLKNNNKNIDALLDQEDYKAIIRNLLKPEGLNYGNLPKGLLKFHKYENFTRTPAEEHLKEGYLYARNNKGEVNIHFTVSPEHRPLFEQLITQKQPLMEKD